MPKYRVQLEVKVEDGFAQDQVEAWILFELKASSSLPINNPLDRDLIPEPSSVRIEKL